MASGLDEGNEPLLVVCDMDRLEVHTNFTSTEKRVYGVDDLPTNKRLNATTAYFNLIHFELVAREYHPLPS
jgi:hypothetical protein